MRNPFRLKNSLEGQNRQIQGQGESLDFEESLAPVQSSQIMESRADQTRVHKFFVVLSISVIVLIFGRLYYLTVPLHQYYREIAEGNRLRVEYLPAPRGTVYDFRGQILAANQPSFELVASPLDLPKDLQELDALVAKVSEIVGMPPQDLKKPIAESNVDAEQSILIKQNLTRDEALIFSERAASLRGFRVINTPIRDYKTSEVYSHLLGYVGKIGPQEYQAKSSIGYLYNDSIGKTGLEAEYEDLLRGQFGQRQVEVDARGTAKKIFGEKQANPGNNMYLNIDAGLQEKLFSTLQERLRILNRKSGAAIAMNPQNGRILAMVSMPSFDNNLFAQGISSKDYATLSEDKNRPLFNRAIGGTYPPGSTVKPMDAAAGLQEGVITEKTVINDSGSIVIRNPYGGPDFYFYGYRRAGLGLMDVRHAIAMSSDIFFYIVGGGYDPVHIAGLGIQKLAEYFHKFGLGERLGIDLPGEQDGLVPTPEWKKQRFGGDDLAGRWYLGDTYHVAIGQGDLLVTPLQLVSWTSTIANGGKIFRPFVVDRIEDQAGKLIKKNEPQLLGETGIDPKYIEVSREGMRLAVIAGTAKSLNSLPVAVAAKTGTAQFDARNPSRTHAWFTSFAPFDNPEIALIVLIEDGGEGGINAVPVVREVLDWWAKNRYLHK